MNYYFDENELIINMLLNDRIANYSFAYDYNWKYIYDFIKRNKLDGLLSEMILSLNLNDELDCVIREDIKKNKISWFFMKRFFIEFFTKLNIRNIPYILLKGASIEKRLKAYDSYRRNTGDIDIFVNHENYNEFKDFLVNEFSVSEIHDENKKGSHEVKFIIQFSNNEYLVEVKRNHKNLSFDQNDILFCNKDQVEIYGVIVSVMDVSSMIISQSIYIDYYFSTIESILLTDKANLLSLIELRSLIIDNIDSINWNELKKNITALSFKERFIRVLENINSILPTSCFDIVYNLISENRNLRSIQENQEKQFTYKELIFSYEMVRDSIENRWGFYKLTHDNEIQEFSQLSLSSLIFEFSICIEHDKIVFIAKSNQNFETIENIVINLNIYSYDKYDVFRLPYRVFSFSSRSNWKAYHRFTVDGNKKYFPDRERNLDGYQNRTYFSEVSINQLTLVVDVEKYGVNIKRGIGYDIKLFEYSDDYEIIDFSNLISSYDKPLIICVK